MKLKNIIFSILIGFVFVLFAGCNTDSTDSPPSEGETTAIITVSSQTKYFSLNPFKEITGAGIATNAWDIAFGPLLTTGILTNSGSTAADLSSGGNGGVWHTDKTDIETTTLGDRVMSGSFVRDTDMKVYRSPVAMGGGSPPPDEISVNVMTHFGWIVGDGTLGSPYSATPIIAIFQNHAKAFVGAPAAMPPAFAVTNQVYIIRHGVGGSNFSRIQITGYTNVYTAPDETYVMEYLPL